MGLPLDEVNFHQFIGKRFMQNYILKLRMMNGQTSLFNLDHLLVYEAE